MAPLTMDQIQTRVAELSVQNSAYQQRYAGLLNIFNAAATLKNGSEMDELRARVHGTIDEMLDNAVTLQMLIAQALDLKSRERAGCPMFLV